MNKEQLEQKAAEKAKKAYPKGVGGLDKTSIERYRAGYAFGYKAAMLEMYDSKEPIKEVVPTDWKEMCRWVKATERLPEGKGKENSVVIKCTHPVHPFVTTGFRNYDNNKPALYMEVGSLSFLTIWGDGDFHSTVPIGYIEWLEEVEQNLLSSKEFEGDTQQEQPSASPVSLTCTSQNTIEQLREVSYEDIERMAMSFFKQASKTIVFTIGWMDIFEAGFKAAQKLKNQ